MIRTLLMIAVAGFLVSAVTLSVAVAITGPAAIANGAWSFGPDGWGWRGHEHGSGHSRWSMGERCAAEQITNRSSPPSAAWTLANRRRRNAIGR